MRLTQVVPTPTLRYFPPPAPGTSGRTPVFAGIAQLVEQLICNQQVVGSNPSAGSNHFPFPFG